MWFEAKANGAWTFYEMFTQLLHYVQVALNKGDHVPPLLCVMDTEKAAIMQSSHVIPFLAKKTIKWGKSVETSSTLCFKAECQEATFERQLQTK